jgi:hypothetical protein
VRRAAAAPTLAGWILAGLVLVLPFEPRWPVLSALGLEFTLLEGAAALATLGLLWILRARVRELLRRPPLPVLGLAAFAAVHFVSAAWAPSHRLGAAVFSLRMTAAAVLAVAVAACDRGAVRRALAAMVAMAGVVAALAVLEGLGMRDLDPFLDRFRAGPYLFEGSRRASATTESPNLAASLVACGLAATAGLAAPAARAALSAALLSVPLAAGLLFTYSRGGLMAAAAGAALVHAAAPPRLRGAARGVLAALLGVGILLASGDAALRRRLFGAWLTASDAARYEPLDARLVLSPGEARHVSLRVTNTGSRTWLPAAQRLECAWFADGRFLDAGCGAALPGPVAPGDTIALTAMARAPDRDGSYFLVWNVVDDIGPFSFQGIAPGLVPAAVGGAGAASLPSSTPSIVSPRSRQELWRLAWEMWRARPWLGFGPDNFRKLHADFGGWPSGRALPGDSAHSAYLEAAASTGALGLVALVATLAASFAAAWRALTRAPGAAAGPALALLGLLGAIATHATVDFLQSFTAQYIVLGFVVGAAPAVARDDEPSAPTAAARAAS